MKVHLNQNIILNLFRRMCVNNSTILLVAFFVFTCLSSKAYASTCKVFLTYYNMEHPQPKGRQSLSKSSPEKLLRALDALPGNSIFSKLYRAKNQKTDNIKKEIEYLSCIYDYLVLDIDRDGVRDWTITSQGQLLDMLIPYDKDWDNDSISNIYDKKPLEKEKVSGTVKRIPEHLRLSKIKKDKINKLQDLLFSDCGVLAMNYSDRHSVTTLEIFLKLCKASIQNKSKDRPELVLYAFLSHAFASDVVASYYPELNAMSIGGEQFDKDPKVSQNYFKRMIAHEIGHFLVFNYLTPDELERVACKFGHWKSREKSVNSFFDTFFLKPFSSKSYGYMPTKYSRSNIHEWFSEVFSEYLYNKVENNYKNRSQGLLALGFDSWISNKIGP